MKQALLFVAAAALLLNSASFLAHHGDAGRYEDNTVVMTGTVVEVLAGFVPIVIVPE